MNIHQMVISGSFDASGYPLPDAVVVSSLTPESRQRCLEMIAPFLADSGTATVARAGGSRLILPPQTDEMRLLAMAYYESDETGS
ncbi:MAG: hypothetical protein Q4C47_02905, partial [Planctomycetia bacterium]|nr:hypothetical protein [Planctomycetia bacterium]